MGICVPTDRCAPGTCTITNPSGDFTCDEADDDCDTLFDEDVAPTATSCGTGQCSSTSTEICINGSLSDDCTPGSPAANDATCDGLDDDCDALIDEDFVGGATSCGVGACFAQGSNVCTAGSAVDSCTPGAPAASDATCDAIDDDCSGAADEDFVGQSTSCGVGVCVASGTTTCTSGVTGDTCTPGAPTGLDNDCDGIDDDKTSSLVVSPKKSLWHCLGTCDTSGSAIDWAMKCEGVSFRHAEEVLREDAGPSDSLPKGRRGAAFASRRLLSSGT